MGLLDSLGPLITGANRGLGAYAQGQVQADAQRRQQEQQDADRQTAAEDREREIRMEALRRQLLEAQIGQTNARTAAMQAPEPVEAPSYRPVTTDKGIFAFDPSTGSARPVQGPEGSTLRPPPRGTGTAAAPRAMVVGGQPMVFDPETRTFSRGQTPEGQEVTPAASADPLAGLSPVDRRTVTNNRAIMEDIREAERLLKANPAAIGMKGMTPDFILQRTDPDGVEARAALANVASTITLARSGGAVSDAEFQRLEPFLPKDTDTSESAAAKLRALIQHFERKNTAITGRPAQATPVNDGSTAPDSQSNAAAKDRGAEGGAGGGGGGGASQTSTAWQDRARELKDQGLTPDQVVAQLRTEGFVR